MDNAWGGKKLLTIEVSVDSTGAYSFFYDTCPDSKLSGCFDRKEKWVRELMESKEVRLLKVKSEENMADIFTKCLPRGQFLEKRNSIMGLAHEKPKNFGGQLFRLFSLLK